MILGDGERDEGTLHEAGRMLLRKSGADNVLITRGAHGLTLFGADGADRHRAPPTRSRSIDGRARATR